MFLTISHVHSLPEADRDSQWASCSPPAQRGRQACLNVLCFCHNGQPFGGFVHLLQRINLSILHNTVLLPKPSININPTYWLTCWLSSCLHFASCTKLLFLGLSQSSFYSLPFFIYVMILLVFLLHTVCLTFLTHRWQASPFTMSHSQKLLDSTYTVAQTYVTSGQRLFFTTALLSEIKAKRRHSRPLHEPDLLKPGQVDSASLNLWEIAHDWTVF